MVSSTQAVQPTASSQDQALSRSSPPQTSAPSPPVQQTMPTQTFSSPQPLAQQTTPPISERATTPMMTEPPSPTSTQPAEPIKHETVAPMAAELTSIVKPADAPTAVTSEFDAQTVPSSTLSSIIGHTPQPDQASPSTQMSAISPTPPNAQAKRDYGWLSETILHRVEELKRYPVSARVDRAEGKALVKAVINEDGSLGEVEVVQSSGYPALDKAAVETMRQAAPFHLPHPLGQPRMTIKIPMSYRLDR
ncbi:MAG: TonB family protein [Nitrospirae bacterium]|nr:TonB family protein [Nitrospirota bacterium]